MENLLEVKNLNVVIRTHRENLHLLRDVSFSLKKGEILGIVGESGSGKTLTSHSIMGLLDERSATVTADKLEFNGMSLLDMSEKEKNAGKSNKTKQSHTKRIPFILQNFNT